MKKVILFGGTTEGRQLADVLNGTKIQLHICVTTEYAKTLLPQSDNITIHVGCLDEEMMTQLFVDINPDLCIDATHPYAVVVTENVIRVCEQLQVEYHRVVRDDVETDNYDSRTRSLNGEFQFGNLNDEYRSDSSNNEIDLFRQVVYVDSVKAAASFLAKTEGNILITTGSKELEEYTVIPDYENRCFARVLSTVAVVEKCDRIGFRGKNLFAMQGPFNQGLNEMMLKQVNASWLVTKASGMEGGYFEKCEAAINVGAKLVVIGRPGQTIYNVKSMAQMLKYLQTECEIEQPKASVYLVGMGPGNAKLLTRQAYETLEASDLLIGAKRVLEIYDGYRSKAHFISYKKEDIVAHIKDNPQYQKIAICYSGDIGFCSGAKDMEKLLAGYEVTGVAGISSVVYFLDLLHVDREQVKFDSCHGKELTVLDAFGEYDKLCLLLGRDSVREICRQLKCDKSYEYTLTVGERLSYEDERIVKGNIEEIEQYTFDSLSVMLIER